MRRIRRSMAATAIAFLAALSFATASGVAASPAGASPAATLNASPSAIPIVPTTTVYAVGVQWAGFLPSGPVAFEECESGRADARCMTIDIAQDANPAVSDQFGQGDTVVDFTTVPTGFECNIASACEIRASDAAVPADIAVAQIVFNSVVFQTYIPRLLLNDDTAVVGSGATDIIVLANDSVATLPEVTVTPLSITGWSRPHHGSVTCAAVCTYTPDPAYVGTDTFRYQATTYFSLTGYGPSGPTPFSDAALVTVTVTGAPDQVLPEVPVTALLPVAGAAVGGLVLAGKRRRHSAR
jgi:hypothetical protein